MNTITDTFSIGTNETEIMSVPENINKRKIYYMILNEESGSANTLTLNIYASDGTTLIKSFKFNLSANQNKEVGKNVNTPIINLEPGNKLKMVAGTSSIEVLIDYYDE